ncbi:purine-nucleoside phosphorylase [Gemmata sp.]|uniref:purine-nucleoside phosphorylase n=1 Tax=Gemmata sp. TaxID=1914242 RepID=UPI003F71F8D9
MSAFSAFTSHCRTAPPRVAVVLGSGLGGVARAFVERAAVPFADVPGFAAPTVHGHRGELAVGLWSGTPALVFHGRMHYYEGHPRGVVTAPVRVAAELGVTRLVLTNAAGGIHPSLDPGSLMAIRAHLKVIGAGAWRAMASGTALTSPYSPRLLDRLAGLLSGVYAALTGPSYETPAEIRALAACGADAVGMSTALEAEAAAELGMEVAAISCVTNRAAGLSAAALDHKDVLVNAKLAVGRLGDLIGEVIAVPS